MKKYFVLFSFIALAACDESKKYCGEIIDKGYDPPSSGHKTSRDPEYFFIMKVDSINTAIRINVTIPFWYSISTGQRTCIDLNEMDLSSYGNGSRHLIK